MRIYVHVWAIWHEYSSTIRSVHQTSNQADPIDMSDEGWLFLKAIPLEVPDVEVEVSRHEMALVKKTELNKMRAKHTAEETELEGVIQSLLSPEHKPETVVFDSDNEELF